MEWQSFDTYQVRRFHVFQEENKLAQKGVTGTSNDGWFHTSESAINGNNTLFWVSELESTQATIMVDLLEEFLIVGDMEIHWRPQYA